MQRTFVAALTMTLVWSGCYQSFVRAPNAEDEEPAAMSEEPGECVLRYNTGFQEFYDDPALDSCCYREGGENRCALDHRCDGSSGNGSCCVLYLADGSGCCHYSNDSDACAEAFE